MRQQTKQEAISILQRLIEQTGSITHSDFKYPEVEKWKRSVKLALRNIGEFDLEIKAISINGLPIVSAMRP